MEQTIAVLDKVGIKDIDHYISSICEWYEQSNSFQTMNPNRTYKNLVFYNDIQDVIQFGCSFMSDSATPWTAARQASLSITNSQSLLKLMSIESVMPSNHLFLCPPLLLLPSNFPSIGVFSKELSLHIVASGGQSIGVSASASVLPMNTRDWSLLGWTGWISFQSKGLSRVFSNTTVQKHQFFSAQLSL